MRSQKSVGDIEGEADDGGAFQEPGAVKQSEGAQPEQRHGASAQHAAQQKGGQPGQYQEQTEDQTQCVSAQHGAQIGGVDRHDLSFPCLSLTMRGASHKRCSTYLRMWSHD